MKLPTYISILLLAISLVNCKKDAPEILDLPQIDNFSLREDTVGAVVTILGKNFSETSSNNIVIFNSAQANPFYSRRDTLKVKVPNGASTGTIQVKVYSKLCVSKDTFFVLTGKWTKMADCPEGGRFDAVGFSVGNIGYISNGTGYDKYRKDSWAFNPARNTWTRVADFPDGNRREAVSFSIGNKAYVGYGTNTDTFSSMRDFYEFDPETNKWTRKADIPLLSNNNAVGLTLNGKGYIITGDFSKQVLEYDPVKDHWTEKKDFPGEERTAAAGFVINGKGYIAGGGPGPLQGFVDLWEYDASVDKWTRKADMKPIGYEGIGFSVKGKGYVGNTNWAYKQLWEYDPSKNKWTKKKNFPGIAVSGCVSFVIDDIAYVATGVLSNNVSSEIWKFEPE